MNTVLVIFLLVHIACSLEVLSPPVLAGYYPSPVIHRFNLRHFPAFTGNVAVYPGPDIAPNANLTGLIAFIPAQGEPPGKGLEYKARGAKAAGAMAIIVMSEVPSPISGFSDIVWNDCCPYEVAIPVVELSLFNGVLWLTEGGVPNSTFLAEVNINDEDINPWRSISVDSLYSVYFGLVWCFVAGLLTVYATYKLYRFWKVRGPELSTGFIFLCIESFCNFERFIYYLLDPMFTRQFLPHVLISPLYTCTTPFTFIACLLITLTWVEIQRKAKLLSPGGINFLSLPLAIIFIVLSIALIISELVIDVYRGLMYNVGTMITIIWSIQGGLGIIFAIIFWVQGFRLLRLMKDLSDGDNNSVARNTTRDLMISGIFVLGFSLMLLLSCAAEIHFGTIGAWYSIQNLWMFFISLISFTQLLALPTAAGPKTSRSGTSTLATQQSKAVLTESKSQLTENPSTLTRTTEQV